MKKSLLLFALVLLLAGCASTGNQAAPAGGNPGGLPLGGARPDCGGSRKNDLPHCGWGGGRGAGAGWPGGRGGRVYPGYRGAGGGWALADGAMVEVGFDGMILETYPPSSAM